MKLTMILLAQTLIQVDVPPDNYPSLVQSYQRAQQTERQTEAIRQLNDPTPYQMRQEFIDWGHKMGEGEEHE